MRVLGYIMSSKEFAIIQNPNTDPQNTQLPGNQTMIELDVESLNKESINYLLNILNNPSLIEKYQTKMYLANQGYSEDDLNQQIQQQQPQPA